MGNHTPIPTKAGISSLVLSLSRDWLETHYNAARYRLSALRHPRLNWQVCTSLSDYGCNVLNALACANGSSGISALRRCPHREPPHSRSPLTVHNVLCQVPYAFIVALFGVH
jgi:hypothetical protein